MIPKKIHYCWFSNEPFPQMVQDCIASWKTYMPDWEYVLWDYDRIKAIDSVWLKECLEVKKWAFAADFVRLWAVYHEGGVYLDSDVFIYQSLEPFLRHRFFIGRESVTYQTFDDGEQVYLTSHCFGAEAGHPFLEQNLRYYQDRHFIQCSSPEIPNLLRFDMLMLPYIQGALAEPFGYDPAPLITDMQQLKEDMVVYPPYYFCWSPDLHDDIYIPKRYAKHIGLASWREQSYWDKHKQHGSVTFSYKIRWRFITLLGKLLEKLDYKLVRIHPDGRL